MNASRRTRREIQCLLFAGFFCQNCHYFFDRMGWLTTWINENVRKETFALKIMFTKLYDKNDKLDGGRNLTGTNIVQHDIIALLK